ncbi:hypothetical protein [Pyxidicoccus xibeiensis]|uniref:hypothetical protein n=1 Tax=Pyxidicoccus xibeiensis TaxID=2906759 RepID=UPI0020A823E4|nr:hypothetical protein [Pyxidicoccus xibeiensis]MCP3136188.1 hypothetical protein [Pyxidicoccus xibeiensis]
MRAPRGRGKNVNRLKRAVVFAATLGLVGCGDDYPRVYDVELDAAELLDVPTRCKGDQETTPQGPARNVAAQQRWTFRNPEVGVYFLEVPDVDIEFPAAPYRIDANDAPDVLSPPAEAGPFEFLHSRLKEVPGEGADEWRLRFAIDGEALGDSIQGSIGVWHLWLVTSHTGVEARSGDCLSTLSFTGRRVEE